MSSDPTLEPISVRRMPTTRRMGGWEDTEDTNHAERQTYQSVAHWRDYMTMRCLHPRGAKSRPQAISGHLLFIETTTVLNPERGWTSFELPSDI